jgi:glycosyltransferase involved in cell wall biosynthesis
MAGAEATGGIEPVVGIGALSLSDPHVGGLNRYSWEISQALIARFEKCLVYTALDSVSEPFGRATRRVPWQIVRRSDFIGNSVRLLWQQTALRSAVRRDALDVYYAPVPEGMLAPVCPQVVTVHDLLPLRYPDVYPRLRHYFRLILPTILRRSAAIITDSESTRRDLQEFFPDLSRPVHVVYPGFSAGTFTPASPDRINDVRDRFGLGRFVLAVGETRPYKNIRALIESFAMVRDESLQLAIAGNASRFERDLRELPRQLGEEGRVRFLGTVSDDELAALYSAAELFVFPSLYEGFGFPPLEAMACGCPVVVSNAASIPEVCGTAGIYVEPTSRESIAAGISRVADDPALRLELRERGLERARGFSYASASERIAVILRECASSAAAVPSIAPAATSTA